MQHGQPQDLSKFEFNKTYTGKTYQYVMTGIVMKNLCKYWGVLSPSEWALTLTAATIQPAAEYTGSETAKTFAGYTALGISFVLNPITAGISFAAHTVSNEFLEVGWERLPDYIRHNWLGHEAFALAHVCKNESIAYGVRKYEEYKLKQEENKPQSQENKDNKDTSTNEPDKSEEPPKDTSTNEPDKSEEPPKADNQPKPEPPKEEPKQDQTNQPAQQDKGKHHHKHRHKHRTHKSKHASKPNLDQKMQSALDEYLKQQISRARKSPAPRPAPANTAPENKIEDLLKKGYKAYKHEKRNGKGHTKGGHMNAADAAEHLKSGGELEFKKAGSKIWMKDEPKKTATPAKPATNSSELKAQLKKDLKNGIHLRSKTPPATGNSTPSAASLKIDELNKEGYRFYKKENGVTMCGHLQPEEAKNYLQAGGKIECKKFGETKISLSEQTGSSAPVLPPSDETTLSVIKQVHSIFFGKPHKKKHIAPQPAALLAEAPDNHVDNHPAPNIDVAAANPQPPVVIDAPAEERAMHAAPELPPIADQPEANKEKEEAELLIEEGDICNSELTSSSSSDNESCDEANNNAFSSDDEDDEEQNKLIQKVGILFGDLRNKIKHYSELSIRVQHGMFAGQQPVNIRDMNEILEKIESGETSFKDGIKSIAEIAKHNGVIHAAAAKCFDFINGNTSRFTM